MLILGEWFDQKETKQINVLFCSFAPCCPSIKWPTQIWCLTYITSHGGQVYGHNNFEPTLNQDHVSSDLHMLEIWKKFDNL
jgi:hypothetical protein